MKIAVTGANGSIGSEVCRQLAAAGHELLRIDVLPAPEGNDYIQADLCDYASTLKALEGAEQVAHLAALPDALQYPPEEVMRINMQASLNVFEAARELGIRRVVYAGSESGSGFALRKVDIMPLYLPIDAAHPCWPHETYSLTKHFGEEMGRHYATAFGIEVISLRLTWVLVPRAIEFLRRIVRHLREENALPDFNPGPFGTYVSVRDAARAFEAAHSCDLAADLKPPFLAVFITGQTTYFSNPTLEAVEKYYGKLPEIRDPGYFEQNPYGPVYDSREAERWLQWKPRDTWKMLDFS